MEQTHRTDWFTDARFGMFLHWGLYAIPARGEWVMSDERIPAARYSALAREFDPRHFDAAAWAGAAGFAGADLAAAAQTAGEARANDIIRTEIARTLRFMAGTFV